MSRKAPESMVSGLDVLEILGLVGAGVAIGAYATAVGAGGGFLLAPLLLVRHPDADPASVTMAALTVVAVSSGIGTVFSARERRIDYPVVAMLVAAALPAALLGAAGTSQLPRSTFALFFGSLLFVVGLYLVVRPHPPLGAPGTDGWHRHFKDGEDNLFFYRIPVRRSAFATAIAAFVAALAGIGGGLIYTPLTTHVMRMPHWLAVPASHVVIASIAAMVVVFHASAGNTGDPMEDVPALGVGVIVASRLGSRIQRRLGAGTLTRFLAIGVLAVAIRTALIAI